VAEDSHVPPLPRRAPDDKRHVPGSEPGWGSGLTQPLALPESVRQRIRAALDYAADRAPPLEHDAVQEAEAPPEAEAPGGQPASLPRRVPGANNAPEPPTHLTRPAMLPSLVHPRPAETVAVVPAAALAAIAAAAGTPSDVVAGPQAAAPAKVAVWPAPAVPAESALVPVQRHPAEQRHGRDGEGNGAGPPSPPATPMTRVAMWAYLEQSEAPTEPLPAIPAPRPDGVTQKTREQPDAAAQPGTATVPAPEPPAVPAQRSPAEQRPGQPEHPDARTAGPEHEMVSRDEVPSGQKNGQASLGRAQLHGTKGLARRPGESPPWAQVPPPATAPPKFVPPKSVSSQRVSPWPVSPKLAPSQPAQLQLAPLKAPAPPPEPARPPERAGRGRGFKVGVALALVLALAGSLAFLLKRPAGTAHAIAPTTGPSTGPALGTAAEVRGATAAWVASQVSRAKPISCDPVMCQALRADGVPAADLLVLRPGGGSPLHSSVIVVTPAVTKIVGTEFLTANAPAAIVSFGSGSRQDSVRIIYPQGAAAYAAALRQDIADRKANESALLENLRVTAPPAARRQLQGGQVDSRLLFTLGQLAAQWPLSIVAFGDRAAGASPGVPLRSADLAVTGDAAGLARKMSAYARQLQDFFASARIRAVRLANGQDVVQVEFAAPSPLGLLNS
jgi:hypothetical protein